MGAKTWNHATWYSMDEGSDNPGVRNRESQVWTTGPGSGRRAATLTALPFTNTITCLFSFIHVTGWSALLGAVEGIFSIGFQGATTSGLRLATESFMGDLFVRVKLSDGGGATIRHNIRLGDEDGSSWISADKFYYVGVSVNTSGISYCVNGNNAPKVVVVTDVPGNLDLDAGSERVWMHGPEAAFGFLTPTGITTQHPSMIFGPAAYSPTYLDFSEAGVRDRIWDADGNWKNPGSNGSLWWNNNYTTATNFHPYWYLLDGSARKDRGSQDRAWDEVGGGSSTGIGCPTGWKKQYE